MNIKLRFENPATCLSIILAVIALIYEILAICGVTPWIGQDEVINLVTEIFTIICTILVGLGVITDPTTAGITDSEQAMTYDSPRKDDAESEGEDDGQGN